jgi:hypothetical protein
MDTKEKIKSLLSQNFSVSVVATTVGVDASYISQLLQEEQFALSVAEARCADMQKMRGRDDAYDWMEDELISKLKDLIPHMYKPGEVLNALSRINQAKRRSEQFAALQRDNNGAVSNTVVLAIPRHAVLSFQLNGQAEVISIDAKPLAGMSSSALLKELKEVPNHDESQGTEKDGTENQGRNGTPSAIPRELTLSAESV